MRINAEFDKPAAVRAAEATWTPSPMPGVERVLLDRVGEEVARATSLVRYAAGSSFSEHEHGGGEEFLVLDGVFSDSNGDYPAGSYVRNPPGTSHAPWSEDGCVLFVKLRQFEPGDTAQMAVNVLEANFQDMAGAVGVASALLHSHSPERVEILRFAPGGSLPSRSEPGGEEIYVLEGGVGDRKTDYAAGSWFRAPPGRIGPLQSAKGAIVYRKTGHLKNPIGLD